MSNARGRSRKQLHSLTTVPSQKQAARKKSPQGSMDLREMDTKLCVYTELATLSLHLREVPPLGS